MKGGRVAYCERKGWSKINIAKVNKKDKRQLFYYDRKTGNIRNVAYGTTIEWNNSGILHFLCKPGETPANNIVRKGKFLQHVKETEVFDVRGGVS